MSTWFSNEVFPNANRSSSFMGKLGWGVVDAFAIAPRAVSIAATAPFRSPQAAASTLSNIPGGNPSSSATNVVNPANPNGVHQRTVVPTFNRVSGALGGN